MRLLLLLHFSSLLIVLGGCAGPQAAPGDDAVSEKPLVGRAEVTVHVHGVFDPRGTMNVGLYLDPETWMSPDYLYARTEPVGEVGETVTLVLPDVPAGIYGASLYQDVDSDGDFSRNALGIPTDPWGISNDATGFFGPPSFEAAAVVIRSPETTLNITLRTGIGIPSGSGPDSH